MKPLSEEIREIVEKLLSNHLTSEQERTVWQISESIPYSNLDYVQEFMKDEVTLIVSAILKAVGERVPKENMPPSGSLEDKYGYLAGQRKGFNQAIAQIREELGIC